MNKNNFLKLLIGLALLAVVPNTLKAQSDDSILILDELLEKISTQNPALQASYSNWKASETRVSQEKALPDPVIGLGLMNLPLNSFSFDQEPMTGKQLSFMQPFPYPGKLQLKADIAKTETEISYNQYLELENQLIKKGKQTYYDLFYIDQAISTVLKNQELVKEFVNITETRYGVGRGLQQDVLRAQVELSKLIDRELKLLQNRESLQAIINALVNEPADKPLGKPIVSMSSDLSVQLDAMVQQADSTNPMLEAWKNAIERGEKQIDLAKKNRYPDFSFGIAYTQRDPLQNGMSGYDFVSAMVNVKVPLYRKQKQDQKVIQTQLGLTAVEQRYQNIENSIEQSIQQTITEIQKNQRLLDLYETGIIPQAEESLESSLIGYQNDKVSFLSLLDSELSLFNFQLDYYRFLADYHKATAELESLLGSDLQLLSNN